MQHDNDNGVQTFISMFSGIEAASVAFGPLGWKAICFAEIDKAASRLLSYRYPGVPNVGDMSEHDWSQYRGKVDVVCGGPPCQAFSVAGLRDGLSDARGNLSLTYMRALHAINPRNAIIENVPGWLTMSDNAFGCFLAGLVGADGPFVPVERQPAAGKSTRWWRWSEKERCHAVCWPEYGMVTGPKGRAAWAVKDAQFFGLAQRRERVLVVADFGNGADPSAVLFERVSVPWNPPARGEKGQDVAGTISARTSGGGGLGTDFELDGGLVEICADVIGALNSVGGHAVPGNSVQDASAGQLIAYAPEIARCDATREGSSQDYESTTMVAHTFDGTGLARSLTARHDGSPCVDRGPDIIAFTAKDYGADAGPLSPTLRAGGHKDSHQNGGVGPAIAWSIMPQNSGKDFKARQVDVAQPLMASGPVGGNQGGDYIQQAVAFNARQDPTHGPISDAIGTKDRGHGVMVPAQTVALRGREGGATAELGGEVATALRASSGGGDKPLMLTSAVRRLTPRECERLQGFPDDYTRIPVKWYAAKKVTKNRPDDMWEQDPAVGWWLMQADGPRYKQLGNSWAVPKFRWLGERIQRLMPAAANATAVNDNNQAAKAAA